MADKIPLPETPGLALAGAAIGAALLDALLAKGILTRDEALAALRAAQLHLSPHIQTSAGFEAAQIVVRIIQRINKDGSK